MGAYASAEAAYWAFFETFNAKSASGRAGVMSYPHVRVSAAQAEPSVQATAAAFEASASWASFERAGWAWTQPLTPRVVHRSPDKVHFAGGWTRHRADGSVIGHNRLLYVATKMADGWGIQAGFSVDGDLRGADASAASEAATSLTERTMRMLAAGEAEAWLDCFHYPSVIVFAPGQLELYADRASAAEAYGEWASAARPISHTARVMAVGPRAALVEETVTDSGVYFEQVSLVVERDGVWGTSAVSAVRPDG